MFASLSYFRAGLLAAALPISAVQAAEPDLAAAPQALERIVVSGEQPGPGLWKISKGNNVLWLLGTHAPMPQKMTWRAKGIEKIIAQSQEILGEPGVSFSAEKIGVFTMVTMIPSIFSVRNNPDGKKLREVVPAELYPRWIALRDKYIDDPNTNNEEMEVEGWRPIFAALELYRQALKKTGYTTSNLVWPVIRDAAGKHKVKISSTTYEPDVKDPRGALRAFRASTLTDQACFAKTLERIETDLDAMRARASAWAKGDLKKLRQVPATDQREACNEALRTAQFPPGMSFETIPTEIEKKWLGSVDAALEKNAVTFAVLPMRHFFAADGYLAKLKARGYAVEPPEGALE